MTPEKLRELLDYDPLTGKVQRRKSRRILQADSTGLVSVYDSESRKNYKMKLDRLAFILAYGKIPREDQRVFHKNMQSEDNSLRNLSIVSRSVYLKVKEAYRNLTGGIKLNTHAVDQFSYVVSWYDKGIEKFKVLEDVVPAKSFVLKLQLHYSKILTQYCVFD